MRSHVLLLCLLWPSFPLPAAAQVTPSSNAQPVVRSTTPQAGSIPGSFVDIMAKSHVLFNGQASHTAKKYLVETMGSGVALFDYDNDGLLDIFFANGAPLSEPMTKGSIPQKTDPKYWNRLFHQ